MRPETVIKGSVEVCVKSVPHLATRLSDASFEPRTREVYGPLPDCDVGTDVVYRKIWFQGVQTIRVSDTSGHPLQVLSVGAVR